jgi:hypothetical protein
MSVKLRTPSERRYVLKSLRVTMPPWCRMFFISAQVYFWTISGILTQFSDVISFKSSVKRKNCIRSGLKLPHPARCPCSKSRCAYSLSTTYNHRSSTNYSFISCPLNSLLRSSIMRGRSLMKMSKLPFEYLVPV